MKILNLKAFLNLPEGTLYSKYKTGAFDGLAIKGESSSGTMDWWYQNLIGNVESESSNQMFDILFRAEETLGSFALEFDSEGRDGLFEEDQLFAVYEDRDVLQFIKILTKIWNGRE